MSAYPDDVDQVPGGVFAGAVAEGLVGFVGVVGGLATATGALLYRGPRVKPEMLRDAIDAAMYMAESESATRETNEGITEDVMVNIVNHIRDYQSCNEVSSTVRRAIEQALSAPQHQGSSHGAVTTEDVEAQLPIEETYSPVVLQIVENLRRLVTATPPILPRPEAAQ